MSNKSPNNSNSTSDRDDNSARLSVDDDEADYNPADGDNSIDDEATLEEEEALESEADIADEIAALQEEQDLPIEDLMRMYGYGGARTTQEHDQHQRFGDHQENGFIPKRPDEDGTPQEHAVRGYCSSSVSFLPHAAVDIVSSNRCQQDFYEGCQSDPVENDAYKEHGYFSTSDEDSENDFDYIPEESWRKEIKIGTDFQADVADFASTSDKCMSDSMEVDECVWSPGSLNERAVEDYLRQAHQAKSLRQDDQHPETVNSGMKRRLEAQPQQIGVLRDNETVLLLLMQSQYDVAAALSAWYRKQQANSDASELGRGWSEKEQDAFEEGLKSHGKNFRLIQQELLPNRTIADLVQYYYLWKRTERHDVFVQNFRIEKRQFGLHPTATDFMDHFLNHMASAGTASTQSHAEQLSMSSHYHQSQHAYLSLLPASNNRSWNTPEVVVSEPTIREAGEAT